MGGKPPSAKVNNFSSLSQLKEIAFDEYKDHERANQNPAKELHCIHEHCERAFSDAVYENYRSNS